MNVRRHERQAYFCWPRRSRLLRFEADCWHTGQGGMMFSFTVARPGASRQKVLVLLTNEAADDHEGAGGQ